MVVSIPGEACPPAGRSAPETAVAEKALVHPALDLVREATAGEAEPNGDLLLRPLLPPLHEAGEQPAERTGVRGSQGTAEGEIRGMRED
jgi:hypothetical protein